MNYVTQSFEEFSKSVGPTDLALYAGIAVVVWVLFKDKLSPVQKVVTDLLSSFKNSKTTNVPPSVDLNLFNKSKVKEDVFFELVSSWKQTRDLAVKSNCAEAVKVADQMFPFLAPQACQEKSV